MSRDRMRHRSGRAALALLAVLSITNPATGPALADKPDWAGGPGGGHGKPQGGPSYESQGSESQGRDSKGRASGGSVSRGEVTIIRDYFVAHPVGVTALPPGIAKKLARGQPLPPGIAKKVAPVDLRQRVPVCMNGWECILAGADMLILDAVHGTIADIVRGVVR
ncbi:anti-virulence regulator CigR family protein [Azospirillum baldaniorum]|uniref:anti-virulence regulator CigR family protein n=1 Tax=Azospirillum baldaniorum TaxID=1064539 RepID=UPI0011AAECB4|nr:anti-virulence regulator CigR family protein [Azospirillum baldaniorum]